MGGGLDTLTGGGKEAGKKNQANVNYIKSLYFGGGAALPGVFGGLGIHGKSNPGLLASTDAAYANALKSVEGIGASAKANALGQERQTLGSGAQNLVSSGLYGSTALQSQQRGIRSDTMRSLGNIDSQIAQMKSGLYTGQAALNSQNIGSLASILGGVQYKPGTDYLGMLLSSAGKAASGGAFG